MGSGLRAKGYKKQKSKDEQEEDKRGRAREVRSIVEIQYTFHKSASHNEENDNEDDFVINVKEMKSPSVCRGRTSEKHRGDKRERERERRAYLARRAKDSAETSDICLPPARTARKN